jgi:hypothetical protein
MRRTVCCSLHVGTTCCERQSISLVLGFRDFADVCGLANGATGNAVDERKTFGLGMQD